MAHKSAMKRAKVAHAFVEEVLFALHKRILNVFKHILAQLAEDNKKFQISEVASGARFKDYHSCIEWLCDAGIINACYCLSLL